MKIDNPILHHLGSAANGQADSPTKNKPAFPELAETPPGQPWELLINGARAFASQHLHRRRWRGAFGGVRPDGYAADSIAAEAVAEVWKRPRKAPVEFHTAADELRRLVSKHVDRLRHRKENSLLRNEADLALVLTDDGELISLLESLPAPEAGPAETLIRREDAAQAGQFRASLGRERRLKTLFDLLSAGITRPCRNPHSPGRR